MFYSVFDQVGELYITLLTLALVVFVDNFTFHSSTTDKLQHYNTKPQHTAQLHTRQLSLQTWGYCHLVSLTRK